MQARHVLGSVRALAGAALLVALATPLAACGGNDPTSSGTRTERDGELERTSVKVGVLPVAHVAPLYRAIEQGYFEDEGVEVEPVPALTGVTEALIAGQFDFVLSGYMVPFLGRAQQELDTTVIAEGDRLGPDQWMLLVKGDSPLRSVKDLEGKRIGVVQATVGRFALAPYLMQEGVDMEKVELVEVAYPNSGQALERGNVDAVQLVEPFTTQVTDTIGARVLADVGTATSLKDLPNSGWVAMTRFVNENPDTVLGFQRALEKGAQDLIDDPSLAAEILPTYSKTPPALARKMIYPEYTTGVDPQALQRYADVMRDIGLIDKPVDVASHVFKP